jgi:hypothetical protein
LAYVGCGESTDIEGAKGEMGGEEKRVTYAEHRKRQRGIRAPDVLGVRHRWPSFYVCLSCHTQFAAPSVLGLRRIT